MAKRYQPRHQAQLGRGVPVPGRTRGSMDCGPRAGQVGIDKLTHGQKRPGPVELRQRMGKRGPQQTNILDMKRGVQSYTNIKGRKPLRYYVKRKTSEVKRAVRSGRYVQLAISYRTLNRELQRTGDPNFTGGHSVGVYGQKVRKKDKEVMWLLWDSLDDQRRGSIPQGPRWVPRRALIAALKGLVGGNKNAIWAGVFGGGEKR